MNKDNLTFLAQATETNCTPEHTGMLVGMVGQQSIWLLLLSPPSRPREMFPCKAEQDAPGRSSPGIQNSLVDKAPVAASVSIYKMLTLDHILTINSNLTITTCIPLQGAPGGFGLLVSCQMLSLAYLTAQDAEQQHSGLSLDPSSNLRC